MVGQDHTLVTDGVGGGGVGVLVGDGGDEGSTMSANGYYFVRHDTANGRFYEVFQWLDEEGGKESLGVVPSVTTWLEAAPKGMGLMKYYADRGWEEANKHRDQKAKVGTAIHVAARRLLEHGEWGIEGGVISWDDELLPDGSVAVRHECEWTEEMSAMMMGVERFVADMKPRVLAVEYPVVVWLTTENPDIRDIIAAGQADLLIETEKYGVMLVDWKTGNSIPPTAPVQGSAYAVGTEQMGMVERVDCFAPVGLYHWRKEPAYRMPKVYNSDQIEEHYYSFLRTRVQYIAYWGKPKFKPPSQLRRSFSVKDFLRQDEEIKEVQDDEGEIGSEAVHGKLSR